MSFKKVRFCVSCQQSNINGLKLCSRCKLIRYCSRDCQGRDFNSHKPSCLEASAWKTKIETLKQQRPPSEDSLPLRKSLINMAEIVWSLANKYDSYELAEMYLEDYLCEILFWDELSTNPSNYKCEFRIPFVMILLGKDNDAIIFIHKWLFHERQELTMNAFYKSWLGEFVHDQPHDIDFLTFLNKKNFDFLYDAPFAYVAAILVIKLKSVHEYDELLAEHKVWRKNLGLSHAAQLRNCKDVMKCIDLFTLGNSQIYERNKLHLNGLMKVLNKRNTTLLGLLSSDDDEWQWQADKELWCINKYRPDEEIPLIMTKFLAKVVARLPGQAQKRIREFCQSDPIDNIEKYWK